MKKLILSLMLLVSLVSCNDDGTSTNTGSGTYTPTPYYTCQYVWDTWTGNYVHACFWVYYAQDGSSIQELDMVADVADRETIVIEKTASVYSQKYALSQEAAMKIAKNVYDLSNLDDRSMEDLADFAEKLYGVNTVELVSAISNAQVGNNQAMDMLIEKAASELSTNSQTMKAIIQDLHKQALEASGISL